MKLLIVSALCLGFAVATASAQKTDIKTQVDSVSYSIGLDIGDNLKQQGVEVNTAVLAKGLADALSGSKRAMTPEQIQACMTEFRTQLMAKQQAKASEVGGKNKKEGDDFLAANKKKAGIKTTASGLQYEVLKDGTGVAPKATDTVTVHYTGKLLDGTVFDSSVERNEPATFPLNQVIKGWTEGLQLMKTGSKYRFYIPSDLAYGASGAGGKIGPNAVLVFDVELLAVNGK